MIDRFLRLPTVKEITGRSRTTIYRDMETGQFPMKIATGKNSVAWLESEIDQWMSTKITASRNV